MGKKKKKNKGTSDSAGSKESSESDSGEDVSEKTRNEVLPIAAKKPVMPGAIAKAKRQPPWYNVRILEEERPDLLGPDGKLNLEKEDAVLMDMFIRDKSDLQTGDLIITDDNLDEEDRRFNRYEVQLKYNEGRYTALYLISRQICANNEVEERNVLYAMKTSIRPNSANIVLRMKRELRILNELKKARCPYSPTPLDSGRTFRISMVGNGLQWAYSQYATCFEESFWDDQTPIMGLLDRNLEKLREQTTVFKPSTAFYIAMEAMSALAFLHSLKYIHRDVKLTNICIGSGPALTRIFLIDYGDTVKISKKIRYGTPDIYTLPFWSLDAHKRAAARQRGDAESWFYVLAELFKPGCLPWIRMNNEADVQNAKQLLWAEGGQNLTDNPHLNSIQQLIRTSGNNFDHEMAKLILRDGIDSVHTGPLTLEWVPNARVNLPPIPQASIRKLKARGGALGLMKGNEYDTKPQDSDKVKKSVEMSSKMIQPKIEDTENVTQYSVRRRRKPTEKSQEQTTGIRLASQETDYEGKSSDEMKTARRVRRKDDASLRRGSARKTKKPSALKSLIPVVRKLPSRERTQSKMLPPTARKSSSKKNKILPPIRKISSARRGGSVTETRKSKNKRK
ncbi:hypothetical protein RB195_001652 [Necator americanus]|uniref:non-specific serine/threonine protein kinase n=1 Tax=Necator americanus TaxID=51031 RepID=A0ABR1DG76_NECAM